MTYATSEAVRLWLCIGCGCDTRPPAPRRRHSPQITNNHTTPRRETPQLPIRRSPTQKGVERQLGTTQRENLPATHSQVGTEKLRATPKTRPPRKIAAATKNREVLGKELSAPEFRPLNDSLKRTQQWNQETLLQNPWLLQSQDLRMAQEPVYSRPPTPSHSVVGR